MISFTKQPDESHQPIVLGLDIKAISEDEKIVEIVSCTPIDGIHRGTICDMTVFATTENVHGAGAGQYKWDIHDVLCTGVFYNHNGTHGAEITYRFMK